MKNIKVISIFLLFFTVVMSFEVFADTNLGTLHTIKNGFATVKECESVGGSPTTICNTELYKQLGGMIEFSTTNQCIASKAQIQASGQKIQKCPDSIDDIRGLDNTYPNGGMFALYTGNNDSFIHDLANNYLKDGVGKFNLVLPKGNISALITNKKLVKILNNKRVNIVEVDTMPSVDRWMQDSFQFTSINGKPAIYQLEHFSEKGNDFANRLACELARKCNVPYYVPPDMINPNMQDYNSLNSGGNLEVLPGGTFYRGIIKTEGYGRHVDYTNATFPWQTKAQKIQKKALEKAGNKVLDLDTSFLSVGHVDEIINIVKTNQPAPCNFAVMLASPDKAFELMEQSALSIDSSTSLNYKTKFIDMFFPVAYAGIALIPKSKPVPKACQINSYRNLFTEGNNSVLSDERINQVYSMNCIDDQSIDEFLKSREYQILKRENIDKNSPTAINKIIKENERLIIQELKVSSGCQNPKIIHIPVFFRDGLSYTPDLVNGVVQTPANSPSKVILPRSYFKPFDTYVKVELNKLGVKTTFAHDMGYHLSQGEVHCGSNSARICEP